MTSLADAIEKDLAPLGDHAKRAVRYVISGSDDGVLVDIVGRDVLALKAGTTGADMTAPREAMRAFGDGDVAAFVRLGRVYSATSRDAGAIEELEGARWVEHLVWEGGFSAPDFEASGVSAFKLGWIEEALRDASPLVSAMLVYRGKNAPLDNRSAEFVRYGFWMNTLGAPDVVDFLVRNERAVNAILRVGELSAIKRLDAARAPIAPFARALAKLAVDARTTIRGPAFDMLVREPRIARTELEAIVEDPETPRKERAHALSSLEKLFAMLA